MSKDKDYTFTVYCTIQQSVKVTVTSNVEDYPGKLGYLRNEAEYQAGELPDGDWKIEEVDMMYATFETIED